MDLPLTIEQSNYHANIIRRIAAGDTPRRVMTDLERYLGDNPDNVWENSWVRFRRAAEGGTTNVFISSSLSNTA